MRKLCVQPPPWLPRIGRPELCLPLAAVQGLQVARRPRALQPVIAPCARRAGQLVQQDWIPLTLSSHPGTCDEHRRTPSSGRRCRHHHGHCVHSHFRSTRSGGSVILRSCAPSNPRGCWRLIRCHHHTTRFGSTLPPSRSSRRGNSNHRYASRHRFLGVPRFWGGSLHGSVGAPCGVHHARYGAVRAANPA